MVCLKNWEMNGNDDKPVDCLQLILLLFDGF